MTLHNTSICPTLIGRARERTAISALIGAVRRGEGHLAIISGEAGIGKSRLAAEAKSIALAQGFLVAQGQCFQADAAYPYAPLLDLLHTYLPAVTAAEQEPLLRDLVELLPELALLFPRHDQSVPLHTTLRAGPEQQQRRLFTTLTHLLTSQAARQPILLVIEDVHWSDESTLDVLRHLSRHIAQAPILLLMTYRSEEVPPPLANWLVQLDRERLSLEVRLVPLSRSEVDSMVHAIFAVSGTVQQGLVEIIFALSEGNPFFVEEILKSAVTLGDIWFADGNLKYTPTTSDVNDGVALIPRSVQGMVQQRVTRLSAAAQQALTLAAVAGRRFDFAVLQRLMTCGESHLIALMKELIAAQLVVEESADQFAFRHALIRQAISSALLARERRSFHAAIADALEAVYASPAQREAHLADLSSHFYAACSWTKALAYGQHACEKALALYAPRAAIEHATHALDAAHHLHITPPARIYYLRGRARETRGEFDQALSDYEQALNAARLDADDALQWQCMTALGFLWAERDYNQAGIWFRHASDLADRLADPTMQAHSLNRLGNWLGNTGRIDEGLQAHHDALKIFVDHHDRRGTAETLDLLSTVHGMLGDRITAVEELGKAIVLFRTLGATQNLISSLAMRAIQSMPGANETTYCPQRTRDECLRDASEAVRLACQTDSLAGRSFAEVALAHVLTAFGEFGSALAHAREAQRLASEIQHQQWQISTGYSFGRIYLFLLSPALAINALKSALSLAQELGSTFWVATLSAYLGRAHMMNHDLATAQATLQAVMLREQLPRTIAERNVALVWSELALAQREPDVALHITEHLLATAPGQVSDQPTQPIPHVLWVKGEALIDLSRPYEATTALEDARRGAQERNARPLLWKIHNSLCRAYQVLQRKGDALRELEAARQLIAELASTLEELPLRKHFVDTSLGMLPQEKPPLLRDAARQAFAGLTAREREVAALVAEGKTSRQIAEALVISERTAEVHVSNILRKLGFTSRTQIAVWAAGHGLANG